MANRGKQFETKFQEQWNNSVPDSLCYRLYDTMGGYKAVANVGDFVCYKYPNIFLIDCKSIQGNTLPFSDLRQYEKMLEYKNITGVYVGFIVWFVDHDKVLWIPVQTMEKIKNEDLKSFNINKMSPNEYFFLELPSKKLRTFMNTDYSILVDHCKYFNMMYNKSDTWEYMHSKILKEINNESTN